MPGAVALFVLPSAPHCPEADQGSGGKITAPRWPGTTLVWSPVPSPLGGL